MEEYEIHVKRAEKAYESFRLLKSRGLMEDAASRGYYAILHLCYALLLKYGESLPKTHSGLISKLWALKDELDLDRDLISSIARAQSMRERGDYGAVPSIRREDLELMESIIERLRRKLGHGR